VCIVFAESYLFEVSKLVWHTDCRRILLGACSICYGAAGDTRLLVLRHCALGQDTAHLCLHSSMLDVL